MRIRTLLFIVMIMAAACSTGPAAIVADKDIEKKIDSVLKEMTLEEKVGQMTELAIDVIGEMKEGRFVVDEEKLQKVIAEYKVGSILNAPGMALSRDNWFEVIGKIQEVSMKEIGIPCVYGLDMVHGTTYTLGGTMFPQNINMGASFAPELTEEAARITAYETRAGNCPWTYSPTLDLSRDPRWSRVWENFGEDCHLTSVMGCAAVRGYQGDDPNRIPADRVAVSLKHYLGYGSPRTGKDRTPAYIPEPELREKCFAPFKAAVEAGALTIMANSGSVNGIPVHASRELLTEWLKEGLGWDGMLVTDWADINNLYTREKVAKDKKDAIMMAVNAGVDMAMEPYDLTYCTLLKELAEEGKVPMSRIDDAVRRVLRLKFRLGLFDRPNTSPEDYPLFGSKEHAAVALRAATESQVLLKNDDAILPLSRGIKILLTGPNANSMRCLNGGWSYSWQGHLADRFAGGYNTIYEALCNKFGTNRVVLEQGVAYPEEGDYKEEKNIGIDRAVAAARKADVIVACIGENSYCETPGNLSDLALSSLQRELVKSLAATGKPIVLVLGGGRPRIISDIEPLASGIIDILLPGNYGGDALADILAGDAVPSGKMPYTYPRHPAALTTYDYRVSEETDTMEGAYDYNAVVSVQWPFGYGLSYTSFEYSDFKVDKTRFVADDVLTFSIDVKNTGMRTGKETVMLFSSDLVASLVPENRRLRAFEKVELAPGETKTVTLSLRGSDLAFVGADGNWILEEGTFKMQAGDRILNIDCTATSSPHLL